MSATPEQAPVTIRTVYPVRATLPDGTDVRLAKLVVTRAAAYIYAGDVTAPGGVAEVWSSDLNGPPILPETWDGRGSRADVPTVDGHLVTINLGGCGCGAQALKHYRPFVGPQRLGT